MTKTTTPVEDLRGGEHTPFGEVAYTIQELDGVDAVFLVTDAGQVIEDPHHFDYGTPIEVQS